MTIADWNDEQIETLIQNYRKRGLISGGKFTLSELLLEQKRRTPSRFGGGEVVDAIVALARNSNDGLITYGQLYRFLSSGLDWKGNATQREMGLALERGIAYCIDNKLPILTVLVVQQQSKSHSPDAVRRIFDEAREMGMDVGLNAESFVSEQMKICREFVSRQ